jgi:7,8-dihydropterin-6-yl-methyl-4-(beta-D-ribofuranosyl)aminobenzene 5'-phosphate synthase
VDFIANQLDPSPAFVLPLHCTGMEPRAMLRNALGERCIPSGVGLRATVEGS